jgi:predicted GNAT family acetyltransferase
MDINELESFKMSDAVKFHEELNPRLWDDEKLDPEVRDQLLLIAEDFVEYLGLDNLKVEDVTISGSNAAYSYTPHSDLDLHILVDFNTLPNNPVYQELFTAKKTLYNDLHDITVREVPVELYVQDTNQVHTSLGEYSVVYDKWIRIPKKRRANYDEAATKAKYEKLGDLVELALKSRDPKRVNDTLALIKRYRKSGLEKAGEFGPENLAFKAIRKQGLIQDLYDLKAQLHAEKLSIEESAAPHTFAGKDPMSFKSPNGGTPVMLLVTGQGSRYLMTSDGMVLRNKSFHASTGGEDQGLKDWSGAIEFYDPNEKPGGAPFALTVSKAVEKKLPVALSNTKDGKRALLIHDGKQWRVAKVSDIYNNVASTDDSIIATYSKTPKLNWNVFDYDVDASNRIIRAHPGSPVTHGIQLKQSNQVAENSKPNSKKKAAVLKIQKHLNKKYGANLDLDGILGPLTLKSINKFMPRAKTGLADEPNKTTRVQGKKLKEADKKLGITFTQEPYEGWNGMGAMITAYADGDQVGQVIFEPTDNDKNKWYATEVEVEDDFQRRGIATTMYDMAKKIAQKANAVIVPSNAQTSDAKGLWKNKKVWEASGYIPSKKEKNYPRFKTALTKDVTTDANKKNAAAFGWTVSRAGIPPQARTDGKIAEDLMREFKTFLGEQQEEMFPGYDKEHREKRLGNWLAKSWGAQNGKPQTFYHATTKDFDTFNTHGTGFASALGMAYEVERHGSFFAVDPKFAEGFIEDPNTGRVKEGGRILPVHLSIQSPIDLRDDALSRMLSDEETVAEFKANDIDLRSIYNHFYELERWELFDGPEGAEFIDNLQKLGFDGAIINEAIPNDSNAKSGQVWVAFNPNQVKSVYNRGSFSPDDPRLTKESG